MPRSSAFRTAPLECDCFADEVAIDFGSLALVVDRMRAAFFSDEEEPPSPRPRAAEPACGLGGRSEP
jgi:hypothetical protein